MSHIPLHFDGIGPNPSSLKLLDSGQTPKKYAVGAKDNKMCGQNKISINGDFYNLPFSISSKFLKLSSGLVFVLIIPRPTLFTRKGWATDSN